MLRPGNPRSLAMAYLRRATRPSTWLVQLFRLFAIVASIHVSGAPHFVGDAVELITLGHHEEDDSSHEDDPNHECPPGCPTCHHVHAGNLALPVQVVSPYSSAPLVEGDVVLLSYDGDAPPIPDPTSIYRPPRSPLRHS